MRGLFGRVFGRPPTGEHISAILDIPDVLVTPEIGEAYSVGPSIGVGQTAMVYSATRKRTGEKRALKMFRNETIRTIPQNLDAVRVEIDILRMLPSHPFIVQLYEVVSTPSAAYLSLELVDGGDLLSPIERRGAYPESHARALFAQVVEAVDHMHTHSVVHRDLKPENICFTAGGEAQIKIIDLGAAGYDSGEGLCDLCGTALYAAPEMVPWFHVHDLESANRCPRYGREVDYWSMGVALYVMLSGEAPFEQDQSIEALLREASRGKISFASPAWAKVSRDARSAVRGLLTIDPKARLTPARLRKHKWLDGHAPAHCRAPPAANGAPRASPIPRAMAAEDAELFSALTYLPRALVTPACAPAAAAQWGMAQWGFDSPPSAAPANDENVTRPVGDWRILVRPEPSVTGRIVAHTVRMGADGVFVLPGRQEVEPILVTVVTRAQLLRWLSGDAPLLPRPPNPGTLTARVLALFAPRPSRFRAYCAERGAAPPPVPARPVAPPPTFRVQRTFSRINIRGKKAQLEHAQTLRWQPPSAPHAADGARTPDTIRRSSADAIAGIITTPGTPPDTPTFTPIGDDGPRRLGERPSSRGSPAPGSRPGSAGPRPGSRSGSRAGSGTGSPALTPSGRPRSPAALQKL